MWHYECRIAKRQYLVIVFVIIIIIIQHYSNYYDYYYNWGWRNPVGSLIEIAWLKIQHSGPQFTGICLKNRGVRFRRIRGLNRTSSRVFRQPFSLSIYNINTYIYIYIHTIYRHTYTFTYRCISLSLSLSIYIYIYGLRPSGGPPSRQGLLRRGDSSRFPSESYIYIYIHIEREMCVYIYMRIYIYIIIIAIIIINSY